MGSCLCSCLCDKPELISCCRFQGLGFEPAVSVVVLCANLCVSVCFLDAVVHVPAVQESGLHPFVRDLPSGHQAPEPAAGPRDGRSQTLRLWQVRHSNYTRLTFSLLLISTLKRF